MRKRIKVAVKWCLLVMVININNFYRLFVSKDKYCSVFLINTKTPNTHFFWFKQFCMQTWMERILFKQRDLFCKFLCEIMSREIRLDLRMKWKYFHSAKYEERCNPLFKLDKNFLSYRFVFPKAETTSSTLFVGGDEKISPSIICRRYSYLSFVSSNISYSFFEIVIVDIVFISFLKDFFEGKFTKSSVMLSLTLSL